MNKLLSFVVILALVAGLGYYSVQHYMNIDNTVLKVQLADGVTPEDAVSSMKLRANSLNMKLVAEQPLSEQIKAMGVDSRRIEIYQFCNPLTAKDMVEENISFAAYLPCRIALVEDAEGKNWLVMMNLDLILKMSELSPKLEKEAIAVRDNLNSIIQAGANGDL